MCNKKKSSQTSPFKHSYNMGTSLLQTVLSVLKMYQTLLYFIHRKNNRYFRVFKEYPQNPKEWDKSQPGNLVRNSLVGTCLSLPNLGFLWVFFKYPKISKNGNLLFVLWFYKFTLLLCRHFDLFLWCLCYGGFTVVILFLY